MSELAPSRSPGPTLGRRGFLGLAAGGVAMAAVGASCSEPSQLGLLIGEDALPSVIEIGNQALDAGLVDPESVVATVPDQGAQVRITEGEMAVEWQDPAAFGRAAGEASAAEAERAELTDLDGYLLTPTELALAALTALTEG